jgi:hypothetical protein
VYDTALVIRRSKAVDTDHPIYLFLSTGAEAFRVLTDGQTLDGAYRFASLTLKTLERRLDAVLEPDGHLGPVYVVEFQAQAVPKAWYNLVTKIGFYGEEHPEQDVLGILVLLRERDAPPYPTRVGAAGALPIKVALDRVLPGWLARELENPYVAALAPLLIADEPALRARAPTLWRTVRTAAVSDEIRETLSEVLEFWLFERFRGLTAKETWAMLNLLTHRWANRSLVFVYEIWQSRALNASREPRHERQCCLVRSPHQRPR